MRVKRRPIRSALLAVACAAVAAALGLPAAAGAASPYGTSPFIDIDNGDWNFGRMFTTADESDIWVTTWGSTGDIFTSWGDGGGVGGGGSGTPRYTKVGFGKITGTGSSPSLTNINGGADPTTTWPASLATGKAQGILALPISAQNRIYAWVWTQPRGDNCYPYNMQLAKSTDSAVTWALVGSPAFPLSNGFSPQTFLNFGQNYAGARDGYVYMYGFKAVDSNRDGCIDYAREADDYTNVYLARVTASDIERSGSYQYYTGAARDGDPTWGSSSSMVAVFTDRAMDINGGANAFDVIFDKAIGRYIATVPHGSAGELGIFDSETPWGPWTTVEYESNWGTQDWDDGAGFGTHIPTKWISSSGLGLWAIFSSVDSSSVEWDSFNLVGATADLATSASRITDLTVDNGKAYASTLLDDGQSLYIDSEARLDSPGVPRAYKGMQMLLTANADRTNRAGTFITFKVATDSTVYVAFDDWVTAPNWLTSAFTHTADEITSAETTANYDVYKKTYSAGSTVTLGGAAATGSTCGAACSMYSVFVGPRT